MALLRGRATVVAANGVTLTAGIVSSTAAHFNQSFRASRDGDKSVTRDGSGNPVTVYYHGDMETITLTVTPCAVVGTPTSLSDARASLAAWTTLARGTLVTLADTDNTAWDGNYNLLSCTESRGNTEAVTVEIVIENSTDNDLTVIAA